MFVPTREEAINLPDVFEFGIQTNRFRCNFAPIGVILRAYICMSSVYAFTFDKVTSHLEHTALDHDLHPIWRHTGNLVY